VKINRVALKSEEVAYQLENKRRGRTARRLCEGRCGSCGRKYMQNCVRLQQSVPHTMELRHEKGQGDPKQMNPYVRMREHLLLVRGAHSPDTRDSQSTSRSSSFLCTKSPFQRELTTTLRIRSLSHNEPRLAQTVLRLARRQKDGTKRALNV
jgi:hypothetical protein